MSDLRLVIVKCKYLGDIQDQLLRDQYILGISIKKFKTISAEITPEDTSEKCLLESHKIESKIEQ